MPRKIKVPKITFHFEDTPEAKAGLQRAYNRLFDLARDEIIREREEVKRKTDEK
jgi:hypothetical protein